MKILSLICLATLFISCQTTKVYETQKLTKNGVEIYYSNSYMEDDDIVSQEERGNYKNVVIDHSHGISTFASVVYEKKDGNGNATITINNESRNYQIKKNKVKPKSKDSFRQAEDMLEKGELSSKLGYKERLVREYSKTVVTIDRSLDLPYTAYWFFGKPFVIVGSSVYNLGKCAGCACLNFLGGFSFVTKAYEDKNSIIFGHLLGGKIWFSPSVSEAYDNYKVAKKKAVVQLPEYHKKFCKEKITIEVFESFSDNYRFSSKTNQLKVKERNVYDNSISLSSTVMEDAYMTSAIMRVAGNVVTLPVAAATWLCGSLAIFL